jgi:hypothetical protein
VREVNCCLTFPLLSTCNSQNFLRIAQQSSDGMRNIFRLQVPIPAMELELPKGKGGLKANEDVGCGDGGQIWPIHAAEKLSSNFQWN